HTGCLNRHTQLEDMMNSAIVKRSVVVAGKKTSVSLEDTFWLALKEIAGQRRMALGEMLDAISTGRNNANLSSAVRQYVMQHFYDAAAHQDQPQQTRPDFFLQSVSAT
ncbi:MAG: ribbon-helix-helix domain-containing protein, partial [Pseudolabrys sp.]|nr:ribbon-helix-helix domain-containing protein [Pseudolabrys sp.]